MKILHLPIKKQWFDMIASGEKKEEYRAVKDFYTQKLLLDEDGNKMDKENSNDLTEALKYCFSDNWEDSIVPKKALIEYDVVEFRNGYGNNVPKLRVEYKGCVIGFGKPEWGAVPLDFYYKLQLGNILKM